MLEPMGRVRRLKPALWYMTIREVVQEWTVNVQGCSCCVVKRVRAGLRERNAQIGGGLVRP